VEEGSAIKKIKEIKRGSDLITLFLGGASYIPNLAPLRSEAFLLLQRLVAQLPVQPLVAE